MLQLWGVCTVNWRHMLLSVDHPPCLVTSRNCCYERLNCTHTHLPLLLRQTYQTQKVTTVITDCRAA
jgi:hypothetical protein